MTADEFHDLIDRYGANPRRWPAPRREAASRHADALGDALRDTLAPARLLDALLDAADAPPPGEALRRRVLASFPRRPPRWITRHPWWSGAGLVGIAAAGCTAGFMLMSMLMTMPPGHPAPGSPYDAGTFRENAFDLPTSSKENE
ncbi:hypothetical protein GIY62_25180 [Burkholderia plantarii]|uniref:hypothetical protein n=1 Tax=Burkholderia plantarii TaxID=41899 RepID=UPI002729F415|nr:hypothetical protein [Burkholderia plantarii]WLE63578.1 hypothetical protein GIY62_25180 [Burkholderia plantarii]